MSLNNPSPDSCPSRWVTTRRPPTAMMNEGKSPSPIQSSCRKKSVRRPFSSTAEQSKSPSPESSPDRWVNVRRSSTGMTNQSRGLTGGRWWSDDGLPDSPPHPKCMPILINPWRYGNLQNPLPCLLVFIGSERGLQSISNPMTSLPSPSLSGAPPASPHSAVNKGIPKNWPDHIPCNP